MSFEEVSAMNILQRRENKHRELGFKLTNVDPSCSLWLRTNIIVIPTKGALSEKRDPNLVANI